MHTNGQKTIIIVTAGKKRKGKEERKKAPLTNNDLPVLPIVIRDLSPRDFSIMTLVLVLNFESFFCDLIASVGLVNKNGCKGLH